MPDLYHKLSYTDSRIYELNKHLGQVKSNRYFIWDANMNS